MKKKLVLLLLISALATTGCGSTPPQSTADSKDPISSQESTEGDISELESLGDVEVEKELFDVTLTIPADYIGEITQEDLDKSAEENGYKSITLNDDGSATYVMTKSQHKKVMENITENINQSLSEMVNSEDYTSFTDIKANSDFTEFTITTTSTELNITESFSVMVFYMYGGMYATFNGSDVDNIHVDFVNADSGEIISSADSSDMADTE